MSFLQRRVLIVPAIALALASSASLADPFPPTWNNGAGASIHFAPVAWPTEPANPLQCGHSCGEWSPYGRFQNDLTDPRVQDPSNGGTAPQNYVNVSSSCVDKTFPSIYYNLRRGAALDGSEDVLMFRWRVEQIANTYATGPSAGSVGSSDPWSSALWTVLFDVDGDGFRDLAAHLNGSSGAPSTPVDMIAGIWGNIPTQSIDYLNDPSIKLIGHNPTGFVGPTGKLLNFAQQYPTQQPTESWPNGSTETTWDYGTTRARQVSKNSCNEYFIDYQIPVRMLDASPTGPNPALDGPKITRATPISMIFCSANSLNNPFQKDCAINKAWTADASRPAPFGDYLSFDKDDPYSQPIISSVTATGPGTCPGNYTLTAKVQDTLALTSGSVVPSVKAVEFFYWHDTDADGEPDEAGGQWTKIFPAASLKSGSLNTWTVGWNATSLLKGAYLIGVQALDDRTQVDDDMPIGAHDNRTFSYVTGNAQGEVHLDGSWVNFTLSGGGTIEDNFPLHSPAQDPSTPSPQENWFGNPDVVGTQIAVIDVAINACGIAPTLTKAITSPADGELTVGQEATFSLTIANPAGNTSAVSLTALQDVLPPGFSYKAASTGGVFGTTEPLISGQALDWSGAASIAPGDSATLAFTAIASSVTGAYSNTASGSSSFGALRSNTVDLAVGAARLSLVKSIDDLSLDPGQTVTYTLRYANDSPVNASNVVLTDTLPDGLAFVSASAGGSYDGGSDTITWNLGALGAGSGSASVSVVATVDDPYPASATVPLVNTASIDSDQTDPAMASVSSYVDVPRPVLALTKSSDTVLAAAAGNITYTLSYANSGTAPATGVVLADVLPAGVGYVSSSPAATVAPTVGSAGAVSWTLGSLAAGASGSVTVTVSVDDPYGGSNPIRNAASLDSTETTPVTAAVDVGVDAGGQVCSTFYFRDETGSVGFAGARQLATASPAPVAGDTGASVTVTAPGKSGGTFLEAVRFYQDPASIGEFAFAGNITSRIYVDRSNGPGLNIQTTVFDYDSATGATVQLGQNVTSFGGNTKGLLTVTTAATGTLQDGHRLLWVYAVQSDHNSNTYDVQLQYDGTVANAISTGSTFANSSADYCATAGASLVVAKRVDQAVASAGDTLTYTIDFTNIGGSSATASTIVDTLPPGVQFVAATLNGGAATPAIAGSTLTFDVRSSDTATVGQVSAGASGTLVVTVSVDSPLAASVESLLNSVQLDSAETSPFSASVTTTIDGVTATGGTADLVISKAVSDTSIQPGDSVGYTITVLNAGSGNATTIDVSDTIPADTWFTYDAASISGGDTRDDSAAPVLQWTIATLAPGESATLGYSMTVGAGAPDGLTTVDNTAALTADGAISETSNVATTVVSTNPLLGLVKSVLPAGPAAPGDTLGYTLTLSNSGSSAAADVRVVDPVPGFTSFVSGSATATQGTASFDAVDNRLVFDVGTLAAGATVTLAFDVKVTSPLPAGTTAVANTATVTASNAPSRSSTADIDADAAPLLTVLKSGPASLAFPAATLTSAVANGSSIVVDSSARLAVGQSIRVGGTIVTVDGIAGRTLSLGGNVTAAAGDPVQAAATYSLTYRNTGNADASNVVVSDLLPAGLVYVSSSPVANSAPAIGSSGTVQWSLGTLAAGGDGVVQVTAIATSAGQYVNVASVVDDDYCSGGTPPAGCGSSVTTDIGGLVPAKSTSTPVVSAGDGVEYTITIANTLTTAATGVDITDLLPSGFRYAAMVSQSGHSAGPATSPVAGDEQPQWTGFSIPGHGMLTLRFSATVGADVGAASYNNGLVLSSGNTAVTPFDELVTTDEDVTVLAGDESVVEGYLYVDVDVDGDFDPAVDMPLANVNVELDSDGDAFPSSSPYVLATDSSGYFRRVLAAGTVQVSVRSSDLPAGLSLTTNASGDGDDPSTVVVLAGAAGRSDTGYVTAGTALPPLAADDSDSTAAATPVTTSVLANDDLGVEPTTITANTQGGNGSVSCTTTACTYTPAPGFSGSDSYTYTITDANSATSTATVTITVAAAIPVPAAVNDSDSTAAATPVTTSVLANDSLGVEPTTITANTQGTNGGVSCTTTACTYTPVAGFSGSDSYTYTITDANSATSTATVTITVAAAIPVPAAVDDSDSTAAATPVTTSVLANDSLGVEPTTITANTPGTNGGVSCTTTACTYTPAAGFSGSDSYTYTITDANSATSTATVTITVAAAIPVPAAVDDATATAPGFAVTTSVLANDDLGVEPTTITANTQGGNGSVSCTTTACTYTPAAGFTGNDTYTYTITDANAATSTANVTVTITALPLAVNDSDSTAAATPVTTSVLVNDALGVQPTTITANTQGTSGNVSCTSTACTYTPAAGFSGSDSYTYTITDANGALSTATVTITVAAVIPLPAAVNDSDSTAAETPVTTSVLVNDSLGVGPATITANTQGANGTATCTTTTCTYTPAAGFSGSDSYTYTITDANGATSTATVTITVAAAIPVPAAVDDATATAPGVAVTTSVLANDDLGVEPTTITANTQGGNGAVSCTTTSCTYTPAAGFTGSDTYAYTITDANGATSTATVSVTITALPLAIDDSDATDEATPVTTAVLANDALGAEPTTITANTQGGNGTVSCTTTSCTYTPATGFAGSDTYTYTITDDNGASSTAIVTIVVSAVNQPPQARDNRRSITEDAVPNTVSGDVIGDDDGDGVDSDADGDVLGVSAIRSGSESGSGDAGTTGLPLAGRYGSLLLSADGAWTYTLDNGNVDVQVLQAGESLTDAFTYTIDDGNGGSDQAQLTIVIDGSNEPGVPGITLDKSAVLDDSVVANGRADAGETISYVLLARNAGGTPLTAVSIDDPMLVLACVPAMPASLAEGEALRCTGNRAVLQSDIDAQVSISNTATASGTPPGGAAPVTAVDIADVPVAFIASAIALDKTAMLSVDGGSSGLADAGDVISYGVSVRNTGNSTLTALDVGDRFGSGPAQVLGCTPTTLAPGQAASCSAYSHTVTQADIDAGVALENVATVQARDPLGRPVGDDDRVTVAVAVAGPALLVSKQASLFVDNGTIGVADAGDVIRYTVAVRNVGNVSLDGLQVGDVLNGGVATTLVCAPAVLAPGALASCNSYDRAVTQADIDAGSDLVNVATAQATTPDGDPVSDTDSTTTPVPRGAALQVEKSAVLSVDAGTEGLADAGDVIDYAVIVRNVGRVTLTTLAVSDVFGASAAVPLACSPTTLAPGESATCASYQHAVTQAEVDAGVDLVNVATAAARTPDEQPVDDSDEVRTPMPQPGPAIVVRKLAALVVDAGTPAIADAGDVIEYRVSARNVGNVTLRNVTVADALGGDAARALQCAPTVLVPGAAAVCEVYSHTVTATEAAAGGTLDNRAQATGEPPSGPPVEDDVVVGTPLPTPVAAIDVDKQARIDGDGGTPGQADVGDVVVYDVAVRNTGNVTLSGLQVVDAFMGNAATTLDCAPAELLPGQLAVCASYSHTVTEADVDGGMPLRNVATATAMPPSGPPVDDEDTIDTPLAPPAGAPALAVDKQRTGNDDEDGSGSVTLGDTLRYRITATNTGAVELTGVVVSDPLLTPSSTTCVTLAVAATCVLDGSLQVVAAHVAAGEVVNVGSADSNETDPVDDSDRTPVGAVDLARIGVSKTLRSQTGFGAGPYVVEYLLRVRNFGNVMLDDVQLRDDLARTFPAPVQFEVIGLTAVEGPIAANPAFNGRSDTTLMLPGGSLAPEQWSVLVLRLSVRPNGRTGPFMNEALVSAVSSTSGEPVSDMSFDGAEPDPDGNGVPDEISPTPVSFPQAASTPEQIPLSSPWMLLGLALLLVFVGAPAVRRRWSE